MSRLVVHDDAAHHLGGAVPSPAAAFLLAVIALPALFWLVMLKRTTVYTAPEEWNGRRDLALLLALGTLAFPMEWALKYFTSSQAISLPALVSAIFNVNDIGLDDIADFPAGHALRATVLYGIAAFCVARLAHDHRQGQVAYLVAAIFVGAISATRIYLGAHYPMDVVGGWMAGGALLSILVAVHVLGVDERERARELAEAAAHPESRGRRVAVPRRTPTEG